MLVSAIAGIVLQSGCGEAPQYSIGPIFHELFHTQPAWSPADSVIAYTHQAQSLEELERGSRQIFVLDRRTGETRYIAPGSSPTWSPDGDTLAFTGPSGVEFLVLSEGGPPRPIAVSPATLLDWSPTGGRIALDVHQAIWTVLTDGSDLRERTDGGRDPSWTAEGDSIVHTRYPSGAEGSELFVMAADGSGGRRLTFDRGDDHDPACTRQGTSIAWSRLPRANGSISGVYVMDRIGGSRRLLRPNAYDPSWSPVGDSLAVHYWDDSRHSRIWVISAVTGAGRPVTPRSEP